MLFTSMPLRGDVENAGVETSGSERIWKDTYNLIFYISFNSGLLSSISGGFVISCLKISALPW